jgi:hypothetical protein
MAMDLGISDFQLPIANFFFFTDCAATPSTQSN